MRYLDPKADLTFKKVFGEHRDLVISLLNALLPFDREDEQIKEVEYLPTEMVPDNPLRKNSIVDVRCRDQKDRQFIVEMQMIWSPEFKQRVMFNAAKAYVRQSDKGGDYKLLEPVYSLNLVNDTFEPDIPEYYHYYRMVHEEHSDKIIDGLHLVFVELPKFKPHTMSEKKMQVLWLRYLTEIHDNSREVPKDLLENPEISKAVSVIEESAYTDAQLRGYDKFWDIISVEKTLYGRGSREGYAAGMEKGLAAGMKAGREAGMKAGREAGMKAGREAGMKAGLAKGEEKGMKEGIAKSKVEMARNLKQLGVALSVISKATGFSEKDIEAL